MMTRSRPYFGMKLRKSFGAAICHPTTLIFGITVAGECSMFKSYKSTESDYFSNSA